MIRWTGIREISGRRQSGYDRRMMLSPPFTGSRLSVPRAWIDYNGHLNVGYYAVAFDQATDALLDHLDLGKAYRYSSGCSIFVLESHMTYVREVVEGDWLRFDTMVLDADDKCLHIFHEMHHECDGYLAATAEMMALHVNLENRRAAPFPDDRLPALNRLLAAVQGVARPSQCGRAIGIRSRELRRRQQDRAPVPR